MEIKVSWQIKGRDLRRKALGKMIQGLNERDIMEKDLKIKRKSAADMVCDKMKELIVNGTWQVGEKIPTEKELAQIFGVNRLTVRVALQRLSSLGLLDIRVGDGTYVKRFDLDSQISELAEFYISEETVQNVVEYRIMLELGCVREVLDRYTPEELEKFRCLCGRFQEETDLLHPGLKSQAEKDAFLRSVEISVELHAAFIDMAHNDLMRYAFALAKEPMRRHMYYNASKRVGDMDEDQKNIWGKQWRFLYEALKNKDEENVRRLLQKIIIFT